MKKFLCAILVVALLVCCSAIGLLAVGGSFTGTVVSASCYYTKATNTRYNWDAGMSCNKAFTNYSLVWSGVYSDSGYTQDQASIGDSGWVPHEPSNGADWSWYCPGEAAGDAGYFTW